MLMLPPSLVVPEPARDDALARDLTVNLAQADDGDETVVAMRIEKIAIGTVRIRDDHPDPTEPLLAAIRAALPKWRRAETRRRRLLHG